MPYIPVRELPDPPPPPKKKKPKLTANSFSTNGYVLVEEAPFDPRQVRFMRKKDLQRPPDTEDLPDDPKKGGWLLPLGGGLFIGLLLLMFTVGVLLPWWNGLQTQWHFGDAHISHYDQSGHPWLVKSSGALSRLLTYLKATRSIARCLCCKVRQITLSSSSRRAT